MSSQKSIIEQQTSRSAAQQTTRAAKQRLIIKYSFKTIALLRYCSIYAASLLYCFSALLVFSFFTPLFAAEVSIPEVKIVEGDVLVSAGVILDEKGIDDLKSGISKELTVYIDLFRVWSLWPDEFITGKKVINTLTSDPVKGEYVATSFDGVTLIKKRFRDFNSMLKWALNIKDVKIVNTKEIEEAEYFVRITVESRLRKLPPVIGYLLFFVPEKEFKIERDSPKFSVRNRQ